MLRISERLLREAGEFFEARGATGREGTAMIAATRDGESKRLVIPDQFAGTYPDCFVEVSEAGKLELAANLRLDELYLARVHSHPADEPHSTTDDNNPGLTFEGAISLVVPYFGLALRKGLPACRVYILGSGVWTELPPGPSRDAAVMST